MLISMHIVLSNLLPLTAGVAPTSCKGVLRTAQLMPFLCELCMIQQRNEEFFSLLFNILPGGKKKTQKYTKVK